MVNILDDILGNMLYGKLGKILSNRLLVPNLLSCLAPANNKEYVFRRYLLKMYDWIAELRSAIPWNTNVIK